MRAIRELVESYKEFREFVDADTELIKSITKTTAQLIKALELKGSAININNQTEISKSVCEICGKTAKIVIINAKFEVTERRFLWWHLRWEGISIPPTYRFYCREHKNGIPID